ncbi:hypothetical protein MKK60_07980 [Methylobacterium sp. J-092]|nr:hypothetical protein [Methylobacterium sp. J-092]
MWTFIYNYEADEGVEFVRGRAGPDRCLDDFVLAIRGKDDPWYETRNVACWFDTEDRPELSVPVVKAVVAALADLERTGLGHIVEDWLHREALRAPSSPAIPMPERSPRLRWRAAPSSSPGTTTEGAMAKHCDEYLDDPTQPECLRQFLDYHCRPAALRYPTGDEVFDRGLEERLGLPMGRDPVPMLFARHEGKPVRMTMASRFGDVGITEDLTAENGYGKRVGVEQLSEFTDVAPEPKAIVMVGGIGIPLRRKGVREMAMCTEQTTELTTKFEVTFRELSPFVSTLAYRRETGPNRKERRAAAADARRRA